MYMLPYTTFAKKPSSKVAPPGVRAWFSPSSLQAGPRLFRLFLLVKHWECWASKGFA